MKEWACMIIALFMMWCISACLCKGSTLCDQSCKSEGAQLWDYIMRKKSFWFLHFFEKAFQSVHHVLYVLCYNVL